VSTSSHRARNSRLGIRLFLIYTVFYSAFVLVNAFAAQWSEWEVVDGLNLAVLWGFALIGLAFVLALVYGMRCADDQPSSVESPTGTSAGSEVQK
jgi:uncharacterized membrane protein (DUF485 family)